MRKKGKDIKKIPVLSYLDVLMLDELEHSDVYVFCTLIDIIKTTEDL